MSSSVPGPVIDALAGGGRRELSLPALPPDVRTLAIVRGALAAFVMK
ncbi:hypothetical protein [Speluncibacter jeojiensis]|uniref:Uncharacterized protein n=1 Tax=Speluncibacter jeojiensis TaxID=2710754 RepID=A0A9X4LY73_9ACTN|nr:hypothetical protein [Corynebacteriales bacterium D3-21]